MSILKVFWVSLVVFNVQNVMNVDVNLWFNTNISPFDLELEI